MVGLRFGAKISLLIRHSGFGNLIWNTQNLRTLIYWLLITSVPRQKSSNMLSNCRFPFAIRSRLFAIPV
jgi:hypothetical protein